MIFSQRVLHFVFQNLKQQNIVHLKFSFHTKLFKLLYRLILVKCEYIMIPNNPVNSWKNASLYWSCLIVNHDYDVIVWKSPMLYQLVNSIQLLNRFEDNSSSLWLEEVSVARNRKLGATDPFEGQTKLIFATKPVYKWLLCTFIISECFGQ